MNTTTSLNLSPLVAGTMGYGIGGKNLTSKEVTRLIQETFNLEITSFDMADIYGGYTTEALFGEGWQAAGIPRNKMQFITKCGIKAPNDVRTNYRVKHYDTSFDHIVWSAENSLEQLGTDYLDLLLIHRPDPLMNPAEIAEAFHKLHRDGKVLHFGVSNFTPSQFELINAAFPLATNQVEASLMHRKPFLDGTFDQCLKHTIQPMAWGPLAKGGFVSQPFRTQEKLEKTINILQEKYDATPDQLMVAWLLRHPAGIHPVMGTTRPERLKEALKAAEITLSRQEWFSMWEAAAGHEIP